MSRLRLIWISLFPLQAQPFISIHQLEAEQHRPLAHLTERQWDSLNGYLSPSVAFRQGGTCALTRQVMGYHPYWAGTAFTSYQWNLLSTVVFFAYEVDPATGSYTNPTVINTWRSTSLVPTAQANGTEVQLCAALFGGSALTQFLTNPTARLRCIDSLIRLITLRNANGINIDFEGLPSAQRNNFTNFMQQLRDTLNRRRPGAKLSVALPAVDWGNAFDLPALSTLCDQLFIMGYDFYWSTAPTAGPTGLLHVGSLWGSRCNSRTIIDYLANGAARQKLILGVPYYGFRYPTVSNSYPASTTGNGVSRTYAQAYSEANTYGWNWDPHSRSRYFIYQSGGQWYQTWWHDSLSLAWIYRTVNMQGIGGVGMWALSYDRPRMELWGALRDHFTECAVVACRDTFFDMGGTQGSYFNRENWTWTLAPPGASQISVSFHDFRLENGYDTLFIYDGPSTSSPLIGRYTGTNSPGTFISTSNSLTFRFKSDNATNDRGWLATWTCIISQSPPTTVVNDLQAWYGRDFDVSFTDTDDQQIIQRYVCVADYTGSRWSAATGRGFAYEDFPGTTLPPGWSASVGSWSVSSGILTQTNESEGNTNLSFALSQGASTEWLYHWKMRLRGSGTNRRGGLHIFASDPTLTQRGNSYLLWFRLDNQRIEIYRITNNTLPSPQHQHPYAFLENVWYDIKASYDPTTGTFHIWINNQLVTTWTDPNPLTSGGYVSLRTGNAIVDYDELRVYQSRGNLFRVEVGAGGHARYESPSATQPALRILSLVRDNQNLWSLSAQAETRIDLSPPTAGLFVSGWKTASFIQTFQESDSRSGIAQRFYLPLYRDGSVWRAQHAAGFLYESFEGPSPYWQSGAGSWNATSGLLIQSDVNLSNTRYHHPVAQSSKHFYRIKARLVNPSGNRRWGFHILASSSSLDQRGDSYLIWLRYDNQDIQIYETINNVLYARRTIPFPLTSNTDYLLEVVYDEGYIGVWINGEFVGEWLDETPLLSGSYISLRTNQAHVEWDFAEVWKIRESEEEELTVGPTGYFATQNPTPLTPGGRLMSRVMDGVGRFSIIATADVNIDWTPPSSPALVQDGPPPNDLQETHDGSQLTGNWAAATDPHSGISTYEYAIGTVSGATDVVSWTEAGLVNSYTHTGLALIDGQTYFFGVRARNGAELIGPAQWSNGITYLATPLGGKKEDLPSADTSLPALRLYPNPARKYLTVEVLPNEVGPEMYLINSLGQIVNTFQYEGRFTTISVEVLAPGLYWVWLPPYTPLPFIKE
ncbi:MAG: glycosyl hydrolase family 18 protein [Bacteroidia bacterium]|nr:glycosyl hydrolase family 18 protein [Bacteroidia bacterium]MDW8016013.1 glycosyl hydrolase family 18 protein [Bacteroidia bacterium]